VSKTEVERLITSTANPTIKQIRKLREKKERLQTGLFYIEGLRIVIEALQQGAEVECLVVAPDLLTSEFGWQKVEEENRRGIQVLQVGQAVFTSLASKENPQGIAAVVRQRWQDASNLHLASQDLWVALDSVADPGNLGTILRTSDAVGGKGLILLDNSTDPYDLTTIRASMGAIFSQGLVKTTFEQFLQWKQDHDYALVGTSDSASVDYCQASYPLPMILLMGSERLGLSEEHMRACDQLVSIPMVGRSDSLNLAVASGVMLYEIFNQQRERVGQHSSEKQKKG
jgi:TrmH family RNA methyltransferase